MTTTATLPLWLRSLRPAVALLVMLTLLLGLAYPLLITGVAQVLFPFQARGSLVQRDGRPIGSRLIGQSFSDPRYFWSRPSATTPDPDNALASTGSNFGPLNPALTDAVRARLKALKDADPAQAGPVPVDLVTASASGLDPEISPAAALYQASRVARARHLPLPEVQALIAAHRHGAAVGLLGEPRVNVLEMNLALDQLR